ncbi:SseB family protein [Streptomyces sp. RS10V-4]|uniref:SseB family protein n=1 Tax=Streptomyces rhizoryzae TaxID=2932493 RepID=UPI0020035006|nr:SseB family protein [Streptomyces rhizoryzae]MCK7627002.1 SseB family protein [Streptomyces rhizoryzae]
MQKNIPTPGFADDDGSADPALAAALAARAADPGDPAAETALLSALAGARLLVPVVAVLGEVETGPDGLRREKTSDMAVPTLTAPDGRRALPAFTSMATLHRWRPDARPVAVPLQQALLAAAHEQADTVVIDLAGPAPYQLTGPALRALAEGRTTADPLADPAVTEALRALLAAEPAVVEARLTPSAETDGTLAVGLAPDAAPAEAAQRLAQALAADETLRARLVRGLDLALLRPGSEASGTPLYRR